MNFIRKLITDFSDVPATVANKFLRRNSSNTAFEWADVSGYVSGNLSKRLHFIPMLATTFGLTPKTGKAYEVAVGAYPTGMCFNGTYVWVCNSNSGTVSKIDPDTCTVVDTITVGTLPLRIASDGFYLWVLNYNSNDVSKINPVTREVTLFSNITKPQAIAFDGTYMWITSYTSNTVTKIKVSDGSITTVTVGTGTQGNRDIEFDGSYMWVVNYSFTSSKANKVDITTGNTVASITISIYSETLCFDGTHMWLGVPGTQSIGRIDVITHTVTGGPSVTNAGLSCMMFDGTYLWIDYGANGFLIIDVKTNTILTNSTGLTQPTGMCFDGTHMWVAFSGLNKVRRFPAK